MKAARLMSGRKIATFSRLLIKNWFPLVVVVDVVPLLVTDCVWVIEGGENCCVVVDIGILLPKLRRMFTPNSLMATRFTSANRTCSDICAVGAGGTSIKLVTFGAAFLTTSRILSATCSEEIRPDNIT